MFTGVIQAQARVKAVSEAKKIKLVRIGAPRRWKVSLGASVNVDGICSTVVKKGNSFFEVEYMPETLSKTSTALFEKGRMLNLERSLKLGDPIDGHFVVGHVDAVAKITTILRRGGSTNLSIRLPKQLLKLAAPQGSITLNGVSLTISHMKGNTVTVSLIPYTLKHTNLGLLKRGDELNVEMDLLARYMARLGKK